MPDGRLVRRQDGGISQYAANDPEGAAWHLLLSVHGLEILSDRDKLPPGQWIIRLLVGADDGDARRYDVHLAWPGDAPDAKSVLKEALDHLYVEAL